MSKLSLKSRLLYPLLKISGVNVSYFEIFEECKFTKGFILSLLMGILFSLALILTILAMILHYGVIILLDVRLTLGLIAALLLIPASFHLAAERMNRVMRILNKFCDRIIFTFNGVTAHLREGGYLNIEFSGHYARICKLTIAIPREVPISFEFKSEELNEELLYKGGSLGTILSSLLNLNLKYMKLLGSTNIRDKFLNKEFYGLLITSEFHSTEIEKLINTLFDFLNEMQAENIPDFILVPVSYTHLTLPTN